MAMYAPVKAGGDFEKLQPKTYQAVISSIHDIGTHLKKDYKTKAMIPKHQCAIIFEFNKTMSEGEFAGKRFVKNRKYNFTMSKKSDLRTLCELFVGAMSDAEASKFDLDTLRGINCSVTLEEDGEFLNISNIAPLMDGVPEMIPEIEEGHVFPWIEDLKAKSLPPENTPTQAENMSKDTVTGLDILDWECKDLVTKGLITEGDRKSTILAVAKEAIDFLFLKEDQAHEVVRRLKLLADARAKMPPAPRG